MRLRVLTVGQSPRPDLLAEVAAAVPGLPVALSGALDGLSRAEVAALAPASDADALFTLLPGGEGVQVSKAAVTGRLAAMLADGAPTLLACTGAFEGLPERPGLVLPSRVLDALAAALLPRGRLGLAVPLERQVAALAAARARPGLAVSAVALRPGAGAGEREAAARALAAHRPDLVLLDCVSYARADAAAFRRWTEAPVLLSVAVAARVAACLLPEP